MKGIQPMKNYNFERDMARKMEKSERDLCVCWLYCITGNVSEVAQRMKMSRNTVKKIISERLSVENGEVHFTINLSAEMPKVSHQNGADQENEN